MAHKRFSGLSDVGSALIPDGYVLPERAWINPGGAGGPVQIIDESIVVPAGLTSNFLVRLHHIPYGNLLDEDLFVAYTGALSTGTKLTVTLSASTLAENEIRVLPGYGWIELSVSNAGDTIYITYWAVYSGFDMSDAALLWQSVRNLQQGENIGVQLIAGEDLNDQLVYESSSDGKIYVADPTDPFKAASGFVAGQLLTGSEGTVQTKGIIAPVNTTWSLPKGYIIYAGLGGTVTYEGDTSGNQLVSGDFETRIGRTYDGSTVQANFLNGPGVQRP